MTDWQASDWILQSRIDGEISNDGDTVKLRANDSRREPAVSITVEYADVLSLIARMHKKQWLARQAHAHEDETEAAKE